MEEDQRLEVTITSSGALSDRDGIVLIPYRVLIQNGESESITVESISLRGATAELDLANAGWSGRELIEPLTAEVFMINAEIDAVMQAPSLGGPRQITAVIVYVVDGERQRSTFVREVVEK